MPLDKAIEQLSPNTQTTHALNFALPKFSAFGPSEPIDGNPERVSKKDFAEYAEGVYERVDTIKELLGGPEKVPAETVADDLVETSGEKKQKKGGILSWLGKLFGPLAAMFSKLKDLSWLFRSIGKLIWRIGKFLWFITSIALRVGRWLVSKMVRVIWTVLRNPVAAVGLAAAALAVLPIILIEGGLRQNNRETNAAVASDAQTLMEAQLTGNNPTFLWNSENTTEETNFGN